VAVFDKELNHLNTSDVASSLRTLESYISYMQERLEFQNTNLTKTLSASGTSAAEIVLLVAALQNSTQAIQSSITTMQGQITTIQAQITTIQGQITTMQGSLTSLTERVSALENASTGGAT